MRNPYKNYIKQLMKSEINVTRDGDTVYVGTSYYCIRIPAAAYEVYFRTEKPLFIPLNDGEGYRTHGRNKELPKIGGSVNYKACFTDKTERLFDTRLTLSDKGKNMHLLRNNDITVAVEEEEYKAITECANPAFYMNEGEKYGALVNGEAILLPIRLEGDPFDFMRR